MWNQGAKNIKYRKMTFEWTQQKIMEINESTICFKVVIARKLHSACTTLKVLQIVSSVWNEVKRVTSTISQWYRRLQCYRRKSKNSVSNLFTTESTLVVLTGARWVQLSLLSPVTFGYLWNMSSHFSAALIGAPQETFRFCFCSKKSRIKNIEAYCKETLTLCEKSK